jgi:hypothetical protein
MRKSGKMKNPHNKQLHNLKSSLIGLRRYGGMRGGEIFGAGE